MRRVKRGIGLPVLGALAAPAALAQRPPVDPALADGPWPVFHHDSDASASTSLRGHGGND